MRTLREAMAGVTPPESMSAVAFGDLLELGPPLSLGNLIAEASQYRRIFNTSLVFLQQNMALMPFPAPYHGTERDQAVRALIQYLRSERPDIVGLSECWVNGERDQIAQAVGDIFPYRVDGPNEGDLESDGGLFLLSRHTIIEKHQTIYRQCEGDDCLTNKGVLHARIQVDGLDLQCDVFLSHMQSCPPTVPLPVVGPGRDCEEKLRIYQATHLNAFIQAYSSPQRPAVLIGDLNHDGADPETSVYQEFVDRLWSPTDVWLTRGDGAGITSDESPGTGGGRAFKEDEPNRAIQDPARGRRGKRLDYCFSWPGPGQRGGALPIFSQALVRVLQSSPGRDISDHYGLETRLRSVREIEVDEVQPIERVTVTLFGFRCLQETGGPVPVGSPKLGSDEIEFDLRITAADGTTADSRTRRFKDVDSGDSRQLDPAMTLQVGDPGAALDIQVEGYEVDTIRTPLGDVETGRASLGPEAIRLERRDLMLCKGAAVNRVLPILIGDGGEYAVYITIGVE